MGMSLDFYGKPKAPDIYSDRYDGRWEWYQLLGDGEVLRLQTCAGGEKHHPYCDEPSPIRPKNFAEFRKRLDREFWPKFPQQDIFQEITDWLEANHDVYVGYS